MSDLWQGVGTRGGVVERSAATDGTWDYLNAAGISGSFDTGIQISGPSTSGDIVEYQSSELPGASAFGDINFAATVNVDFASNITIIQPPPSPPVAAVMGKFTWRFGLTASPRLTNPPQGVYFEKTAGVGDANAIWYLVTRDGSGEQREPYDYILPGVVTLQFRMAGKVITQKIGQLQTQFLTTHVLPATTPLNFFVQVIPSDASVDSHFQMYAYRARKNLAYGINSKLPAWFFPAIGKLNWTCTVLDFAGAVASNASGVSYNDKDQSFKNHPGIIQLQAAPSQPYTLTPAGGGGSVSSDQGTAVCLYIPYNQGIVSPEIGGYFSAGVGHWRHRFIVHLGSQNFDWNPNSYSYEAVIGLGTRQAVPTGANQFPGDCYFYVYSLINETPALGHWRFFNDLYGASEDIDTGILAADPAGLQPARWFMLELEKWPNRNQIRARIYTCNRDGNDRVLWERYTPYDGSLLDDSTIGPFYTCWNGVGPSTANGAKLLVDAHGLRHDLAQTASA